MRKRSVNHVADTIFWYAVYMFPIIITIFQVGALWTVGGQFGEDYGNLLEFLFGGLNFNLVALGCQDGIVFNTLRSIFGVDGIIELFYADTLFMFAQWFVGSLLVHLCVDFILFIPRIAHKWLDDFAKKER